MTEPRLRAVVSALVAAIAALAFLVSFRAISEFAVTTGAFPARLGWAASRLHRPRGQAALAEPERQP